MKYLQGNIYQWITQQAQEKNENAILIHHGATES